MLEGLLPTAKVCLLLFERPSTVLVRLHAIICRQACSGSAWAGSKLSGWVWAESARHSTQCATGLLHQKYGGGWDLGLLLRPASGGADSFHAPSVTRDRISAAVRCAGSAGEYSTRST